MECARCLPEHELIEKRKSERKSQLESHRYLYDRGFGNAATEEELLQIIKKLGKLESFKIISLVDILFSFEISITEKVQSIFVMNLKVLKIRLLYLFSIKSC